MNKKKKMKKRGFKKKFEEFLDMNMEGRNERKWDDWGDEGSDQLNYIPWKDSNGDELKPEEILFCDKETMPHEEIEVYDGSENEFYNIQSPGVKFIFDTKVGNFPIALKTREGKLLYNKFSDRTGEPLPYHCGAVPKLSIGMKGVPMSGKSVYYYQLIDETLHSEIARDTDVGFSCDLPLKSSQYERDEKCCEDFKKGVLPGRNRRGQGLNPYSFLVTRGNGWMQKNMMLQLEDIDGQECVEDVSWENKKYCYDYFFLMVGADDILSAEQGNPLQCKKMIDELVPRMTVFREQEDFEILVILTKADLLDKENPYLKNAFANSIETEHGVVRQGIHRKAFHWDVFKQRSASLKKYIKQVAPLFYQSLIHMVPERCLKFAMIASVGCECKETYDMENYSPFCIDEPLLYVLAKNNMYPSVRKNSESGASGKKQTEGKKSKKQRNFLEWILDVSGLSGDGDSDDDEWEEEWEEEEEYQSHQSQDTKKKQKEQDETGKKKSKFKVYKGENETWQEDL